VDCSVLGVLPYLPTVLSAGRLVLYQGAVGDSNAKTLVDNCFFILFFYFQREGRQIYGELMLNFFMTALPEPTRNTKLQPIGQARNVCHRKSRDSKRVTSKEEIESCALEK